MYEFTGEYPKRVILVADEHWARILTAHHLEYAETFCEKDDMSAVHGSYKDMPVAIIFVGTDEILASFICEASQHGVEEIHYIGACAPAPQALSGAFIFADGGSQELVERTLSAAEQYEMPAPAKCGVSDPFTSVLYSLAEEHEIAALAILTATDGEGTFRTVLYPAAPLVFESIAM
jgi:purine-nucleoside phosphorylase